MKWANWRKKSGFILHYISLDESKELSQKLKNVKQKQAPERQTHWFHSRNSLSLQPVSKVNNQQTHRRTRNKVHLSSLFLLLCEYGLTTFFFSAGQTVVKQSYENTQRCFLFPSPYGISKNVTQIRMQTSKVEKELCIPSSQHNFHPALLLSADTEEVRNERVQLQVFVVSVCQSCLSHFKPFLPQTFICSPLLPIHSPQFRQGLESKSGKVKVHIVQQNVFLSLFEDTSPLLFYFLDAIIQNNLHTH